MMSVSENPDYKAARQRPRTLWGVAQLERKTKMDVQSEVYLILYFVQLYWHGAYNQF